MRRDLVPSESRPSPVRIGALSSAMLLNLGAVLGLTLMQQSAPPDRAVPPRPPVQIDFVTRPPAPPAPPMPRTPERPQPREIVRPVPVPVPAPVPVDQSVRATEPVAAAVPANPAPTSAPAAPAAGDGGRAGLQYIDAPPPRYPPLARRRGWQGDVILRVHVGTDGRPLSVEVTESSGHALLDREARAHVLATWRFEPARVDGVLVEAWGRVPISFALR